MIEISQLEAGFGKAFDIYHAFSLYRSGILRHCVAVTNALSGSRVSITSHTASLFLHLAPHALPRGVSCLSREEGRVPSPSINFMQSSIVALSCRMKFRTEADPGFL